MTYFYLKDGTMIYQMDQYHFYYLHDGRPVLVGKVRDHQYSPHTHYHILWNDNEGSIGFVDLEPNNYVYMYSSPENILIGQVVGNNVYQYGAGQMHLLGYTEGPQARHLGAWSVFWWNYR